MNRKQLFVLGIHKQEREMQDNKTLEDKIKLIKSNFDIADKFYDKYSSINHQLNNGRLLLGEFTKYQKELNEIKTEMSDAFKTAWIELNKYRSGIPSENFKIHIGSVPINLSIGEDPIVKDASS